MPRHKCLELTRQLRMVTCDQFLVDALLQTREPLVLQTRDLRLCEAVVSKITQRSPAPERQRVDELSFLSKPLKAAEIEFVVGNSEQVARWSGLQPLLTQQLAKTGDVDLQHLVGRLRRITLPERL